MTAFFVKKFKSDHKCRACSKDKESGYSLCVNHLVAAKLRFRNWSKERRAVGKCCYCDRRSSEGGVRCRKHREINRQRCLAWMAAHPGYSHDQWLKRLALRAQGICHCRAQGRLEPGQRRCATCIRRRPEYRVNTVAQG